MRDDHRLLRVLLRPRGIGAGPAGVCGGRVFMGGDGEMGGGGGLFSRPGPGLSMGWGEWNFLAKWLLASVAGSGVGVSSGCRYGGRGRPDGAFRVRLASRCAGWRLPIVGWASLRISIAGWSSWLARRSHKPKVGGSSPSPATLEPWGVACAFLPLCARVLLAAPVFQKNRVARRAPESGGAA